METFASVIQLKQQIGSIYSILSDRFPRFPKAQETWNQLTTGEEFQCVVLTQLANSAEIQGELPKLNSLRQALKELERQTKVEDLRLEEAYQISLEVSHIQVELMAYLIESVEFPHSIEIKNVAAVMSNNLLSLFDMMEKYTSASDLRAAVARTKVQLMALNLNFLEFDIKNYLTGILGMSQMLAADLSGDQMKEWLDKTYRYCNDIRCAVLQLEKLRLELTQWER